MAWSSCSAYRRPESTSRAELTLSSLLIRPSNVPCDMASGTSGQGVTLGSALKKRMRAEIKTPPGLRIFMSFMSAVVFSGFFVENQLLKP